MVSVRYRVAIRYYGCTRYTRYITRYRGVMRTKANAAATTGHGPLSGRVLLRKETTYTIIIIIISHYYVYTPRSATGTTHILGETFVKKADWETGSACRMCNALGRRRNDKSSSRRRRRGTARLLM